MVDINNFQKVSECFYKDELYSVRDNGAVLRRPRHSSRLQPTDNKWTFGKLNNATGYLEIASARIHRIVATAFYGDPPTKDHVVDHIDTNKQNNRPENLRWVTRLENILLNPITAKRIELICGSVEAFLENPTQFRNKFPEPNYQWMGTVSIEEAQTSKKRLLFWVKSDKLLKGGTLRDWIYNRNNLSVDEIPGYIISLSPNAVQTNWETPCEFPCCPIEITQNPIIDYSANLKSGKMFAQNQYSKSIIEEFAISKEENRLWVLCRNTENNSVKPYSLSEIKFENSNFVHIGLGSFFRKDGAEKQFILAQGLEWTGGATFDEMC